MLGTSVKGSTLSTFNINTLSEGKFNFFINLILYEELYKEYNQNLSFNQLQTIQSLPYYKLTSTVNVLIIIKDNLKYQIRSFFDVNQ